MCMKSLVNIMFESNSRNNSVDLDTFLRQISKIHKLNKSMKYRVPADHYGHSSVEKSYSGAISNLKKYAKDAQIYVWDIDDNNLTSNAKKTILAGGVQNIINYMKNLETQPTKLYISITSDLISDFSKQMTSGRYGKLD